MFTGIVQQVGSIAAREARGEGARLVVAAPAEFLVGVVLGDSIAVDGCCLTVAELGPERFGADCSRETLALTTLGARPVGARVNLEQALTLGTPLGGHLVAGHVDGLGEVAALAEDAPGAGWTLSVRLPAPARGLLRFIARKGSVAVDGVSLTVNAVEGDAFRCTLVPHTLARTGLGARRPGDPVNLEVDLVARYVERLLEAAR